MTKKLLTTTNITLAAILTLSLLLKITGILDQTFPFTYDVGRDLQAASDILSKKDLIFIGPTTGLEGLFYGPWWYYFLTIPIVLFKGDPGGAIFLMSLTGVATTLLAFILGKRISGPRLGLIFAAFTSFSQVMIALTSQLWSPNVAPLILMGILLLLYRFQDSKRESKKDFPYSLLLGLLVGLSFEAEIVYGAMLFVSLIFVYILLYTKLFSFKNVLYATLGGLIVFLPRILFELKNNFLMTSNVLEYIFSGESTGPLEYSRNFIEQIQNRLWAFWSLWVETTAAGSHLIGLLTITLFAISLLLILKHLKNKEIFFLKISSIILLTFFVLLLFLKEEVYSHYTVALPLVVLLVLSIVTSALFRKSKFIGFALVGVFLISMLSPLRYFDTTNDNLSKDPSVYKNYLEVIDTVYREADGQPFNYQLYTPPVHDNTYSYLFDWYGEKKYGYTPSQQSQDLLFFIIEPDPGQPERIEEWLKVREESGEVIKEIQSAGSVIIQKRKR